MRYAPLCLLATHALAVVGASSLGAEQPLPEHPVARYAAAWQRGDRAAIVASYHAEITLHWFGHNALAGDHVGKAAALKALAEFSARTHRRLVSIENTFLGPRGGVVIVREELGTSAQRVVVERVLVFRVEEGLLRECWVYDQDQALIDELIGHE